MTTEVDNKQNPVAAAPAAEDKPAETPAVTAPAPDAGGDAAPAVGEAPAKEDVAAAVEAAAKPEPPVKYNVHRQNFEKDIVYLYQFSRTPVLPSLSPYCLKVETWLRLAGLKYEVSARFSARDGFGGRGR